MITILGFYKRRADLTPAQFHRHWETVHGPLIAGNPDMMRHIVRYVQHRVSPVTGATWPAGTFNFDGFSEVWVRDQAAVDAIFALPWIKEVLEADERRFIDMTATRVSLIDQQCVQIGAPLTFS